MGGGDSFYFRFMEKHPRGRQAPPERFLLFFTGKEPKIWPLCGRVQMLWPA